MSLTDTRRFYVLLRDAGPKGVHSHHVRRMGVSGNPSQRAKDCVSKGVAISTRREAVGRRPGSRYWLAEHAPSDAIAVSPNGPEGGSGSMPAAPLSIEPADEQVGVKEPVALYRDSDGVFRERPIDPNIPEVTEAEARGLLTGPRFALPWDEKRREAA